MAARRYHSVFQEGYYITTAWAPGRSGAQTLNNIGMGPYRSDRIGDLLLENTSWFGDRTRTEIYREAAEKALATAPEKWGNVRRVIMKNILFDGKLPRFLGFDRGPITIIGSLATPHQGQIFESANRLTTFAPSLRMVTDLAEDDLYTNLAGGPSDRRFSKWYASDLDNWAAGRYKKVRVDAERAYDF